MVASINGSGIGAVVNDQANVIKHGPYHWCLSGRGPDHDAWRRRRTATEKSGGELRQRMEYPNHQIGVTYGPGFSNGTSKSGDLRRS